MIGATSRVKLGEAPFEFLPRVAASAASGIARARSAPATIAIRTALRMLCVICTPKLAQSSANLANSAVRTKRVAQRRQDVLVTFGGAQDLGEGVLRGG